MLRKILITLAVGLALVSGAKAERQDTEMGLHIATYHTDRSTKYNEFNPGFYVMHKGATAGFYKNSEGGNSWYIGTTLPVWKFDVLIGMVQGYKRGSTPMLVPSYKFESTGIRLAFIPPVAGISGGVHLMKSF
jgi:hypothetical protein